MTYLHFVSLAQFLPIDACAIQGQVMDKYLSLFLLMNL